MHSSISDSPGVELRILNGPQTGAALPLTEQDLILGSDRACDVVLQGARIAARHASLAITENSFTLTALDGEIAAAADAASSSPWQFGASIYLGDIGVTVERCGETWQPASPPRPQPSSHSSLGNATGWLARPLQHWKTFTALLIVLAVIAAGAQIIRGAHESSAAQGKLSPSNIQAINRIIDRYSGVVPLRLEETPKGMLVHGYLSSTNRVNALRNDLATWRPALLVRVEAEDVLLAASRHFLSRQRSALKVSIAAGHAELSGVAERPEDVKRLAQDLKKNVPGLASVKATYVDKPQLEAWLRTWRKDLPPSGRNDDDETVRVDATPDGVLTLNGTLSPLNLTYLQQALTQHSLRQKVLLAMRIAITPDRSSNQPPTVRSFSQGAVPYVFLSNGKRLMIGGDFEGFQLVAVQGQGPVFERKGG
jgi:type III secretion system YscD/HrpQ family protein